MTSITNMALREPQLENISPNSPRKRRRDPHKAHCIDPTPTKSKKNLRWLNFCLYFSQRPKSDYNGTSQLDTRRWQHHDNNLDSNGASSSGKMSTNDRFSSSNSSSSKLDHDLFDFSSSSDDTLHLSSGEDCKQSYRYSSSGSSTELLSSDDEDEVVKLPPPKLERKSARRSFAMNADTPGKKDSSSEKSMSKQSVFSGLCFDSGDEKEFKCSFFSRSSKSRRSLSGAAAKSTFNEAACKTDECYKLRISMQVLDMGIESTIGEGSFKRAFITNNVVEFIYNPTLLTSEEQTTVESIRNKIHSGQIVIATERNSIRHDSIAVPYKKYKSNLDECLEEKVQKFVDPNLVDSVINCPDNTGQMEIKLTQRYMPLNSSTLEWIIPETKPSQTYPLTVLSSSSSSSRMSQSTFTPQIWEQVKTLIENIITKGNETYDIFPRNCGINKDGILKCFDVGISLFDSDAYSHAHLIKEWIGTSKPKWALDEIIKQLDESKKWTFDKISHMDLLKIELGIKEDKEVEKKG